MTDLRGEVDRARQALMDAEAVAYRLRYEPGATKLMSDPSAAPLLSPFAVMLTSCRQLVDAAYRTLACEPADADGWERVIGDATRGLAGVVYLQALWEGLRDG